MVESESLLPRAPSKTDLVHDYVRAEILAGRLSPGQRLSMDALARRLGVSKIPIREAMQRLESVGLVAQRQHVGPTVAPVNVQQLRGVYQTRVAVEGLTAELASATITDAQLDELDRIQVAMRQQVLGDDLTELSQLNSAFHVTIAEATGYEILVEFTDRLLLSVRRYRAVTPLDRDNWRTIVTEHDSIVDALRRRDAPAAGAAARTHASIRADHDIHLEDG